MKIPLEKRLKKKVHIELALLQDEVMDILFSLYSGPELVLHGGTALWRCYNGNRFSEDLDFYGSFHDDFEKRLSAELERRGLVLLKFKKAPYVIYAKITNNQTEVKLEISKNMPPGRILREYEKTDGSYINIYTLSPENLIREKIDAYLTRKYIRDIYDVLHLSTFIEGDVPGMADFLEKLPAPIDEDNLRTLIYAGASPSFKEIVMALKRRFR